MSEICFVPDSQVIFPPVFLTNIEGLPHPSCIYKDCFDLLKKQYTYLILPSGKTDFSNLILEKLQKFLAIIDSEIGNARTKQATKDEFIAKTRSRLRAVNTFGRHFGDLVLFWETSKEYFWSLVAKDHSLVRKEMIQLATNKMSVFFRICEGHEVEFSIDEENLSNGLYVLIKGARTKGTLRHFAHDPDLLILADCFIYKNKRFLEGLMYLITDDGELYGTASEIIQHPNMVFEDFNTTDRFIGFEPIRPRKFVDDFKTSPKKAR